ncbi:MAG: histidine phosphatase family protein [bacterium]
MRKTRMIITRHCETDNNAKRIYSGIQDVDLNAKGEMQASALGRAIAGIDNCRAGTVWTSILIRSLRTGNLISFQTGSRVIQEAKFGEVDIGKMAGLTKGTAHERFPEECYRTSSDGFDFTQIGGENADQVRKRYQDGFHRVHRDALASQETVPVIVGHGTALRLHFANPLTRFKLLLGEQPGQLTQGSFCLIEYHDD